MSGNRAQGVVVGNEFIMPEPNPGMALPVIEEPVLLPVASVQPVFAAAYIPIRQVNNQAQLRENLLNTLHRHSIAVYALLFLAISIAGLPIGSRYLSSNIKMTPVLFAKPIKPTSGLNLSVSSNQYQQWLKAITNQPASIDLSSQTVAISPNVIKSWLQITPNIDGYGIHINPAVISSSLLAIANKYVIAPLNQVTITRSDGSSEVAVGGQNGTQLSDPSSISVQAEQLSKNLLSNKGFQISAPLNTLPFKAVTPADFSKLLVADVNSKRMYAYQNGQLVNSFLVSAGKPSTPTPIGEFHIWDKATSQTMTGPGYVQPNVPFINYFDHSGDAVHGVYWRPASVFGYVNTSHGCVGLAVNEAKWVFNWAPIGTTVITTPN